MRKKQLAAGLLALTLSTLTACGDDSSEPDESAGSAESSEESTELEPLTDEQVQQALLSETVMGPEFTGATPEDDDEESEAPGCLSALDDLDDIGAESEAEIEFTSTSEIGLPSVDHQVLSYTETEAISARIEQVTAALEGCTSVEETAEDGTEYALDLAYDTTATSDSADEQITLQAAGTVTAEGQEFPIGIHMSTVRVANHVSVLVYTDTSEDVETSSADFETYVNAAAERLATVADGEEPVDEPLA